MRSLLDVNVLIALFDQDHVFNERAHQWLEAHAREGIATCPLTENGLVRILSHPNYSKSVRLIPADVIDRLARFCLHQNHVFWPDSVSLRESNVFRIERFLGPGQVTDLYLLALAVGESGRLVTFDDGIPIAAVTGAGPEHFTVI